VVFDPSGTVRVPPTAFHIGYSPLRAARTWDGAVAVAYTLTEVNRRGHYQQPLDHWSERANTLFASLAHAGALEELSLPAFCNRVDRRHVDDARAILTTRYGEDHPSVAGLEGVLAASEKELASIWSTTSGMLLGLRTEAARQVSHYAPLDIDAFLAAGAHLHIVSPSRAQAVSVPLVVGLVDEIVARAYQRPESLLLALDELANVAPLPQLAGIVSEGGGQGVVTLACLQDLSQARTRWGPAADGFLSLFPTALVLPGVADPSTLQTIGQLSGASLRSFPSTQFDRRGRPQGHTWSTQELPRLTMADVSHGRPGHALALSARKEPGWVSLTPFHRDPRFLPYRSLTRS
jgi:type IV secretory pathway TraG/TraD family ATPase VirD4